MAPVSDTPASLVAIIEDDEGMRRAMRRILEAEGHVTESHATAEEFLASAQLRRPGCLVLDLRLPGMSGIDLMAHLRVAALEVPTILVTGYDVRLRWAELTGARYCLLKPFEPEVLVRAVRSCLA
jgi:FixJ family two-component response regulator